MLARCDAWRRDAEGELERKPREIGCVVWCGAWCGVGELVNMHVMVCTVSVDWRVGE